MDEPVQIAGVDFVTILTRDVVEAAAFYIDTLGLHCLVYHPEKDFAEFESDPVTLAIMTPELAGASGFRPSMSPVAFHVDDVAVARAGLEGRGVVFKGLTVDTGVCHMAFFSDTDGNALMLHHRYAPTPQPPVVTAGLVAADPAS